ncbi:MAG: hypothetical protein JW909_12530 [Planctomycetes bacterium]|nr:hypothetical protein [Planctomycetota bacterium]
MAEFSIVVATVAPDKKADAARALAKLLGIPESSIAPVVEAIPVVLFSGLELGQGRRLLQALQPAAKAGMLLLLADGTGGLAPLGWPGEPVIAGKPLSAYGSGDSGLKCPLCGGALESEVRLMERMTPAHGGRALPDVPQLPKDIRTPSPSPAPKRKRSSVALDIADVEKIWKERAEASGQHNPPKAKGTPAVSSSSSALMRSLDEAPDLHAGPNARFDILASGSSNPKLPPILAKAMGIPLTEARQLAQKKIVPVAKNVDKKTADSLEIELTNANIKARVIPRKGSGNLPQTRGAGSK